MPPQLEAIGQWTIRVFRWHLLAFAILNATLSAVNALMGPPWWAFWPLLVTGLLLGLHTLACKIAIADERWAEERARELNLKSYDRSHIEDLKARYPVAEKEERKR